jgi:hypothetical protein
MITKDFTFKKNKKRQEGVFKKIKEVGENLSN